MTITAIIASTHVCLLNDLMRSLSLSNISTSLLAQLSPDAITILEDSREVLQDSRDLHAAILEWMAEFVAVGVLLEVVELTYEIYKPIARRFGIAVGGETPWQITVVGLVGWLFVLIGVGGEFWVSPKMNAQDTLIQSINNLLTRDAGSSAVAAADAARDAQQKLREVTTEADVLSVRLKEETSRLDSITPRFVLLESSKQELIKATLPFAGQNFDIEICGSFPRNFAPPDRSFQEKLNVWAVLSNTLGPGNVRVVGSKWIVGAPQITWDRCLLSQFYGITVFVSANASPNTRNAANALSDELSHILPAQPDPFLAPVSSDLGLPPIDEESPWALVRRKTDLICVLIGEMPMPQGMPMPHVRRHKTKRKQ